MARSKSHQNEHQNLGESVDDLGSATAELGSTAADLGGEVKEGVVNLTQQVKEQATEQVMSQKEQVVDSLETVALLLHQAGEHAHQQDKELLATYVDKAAGQVAQWSETLQQQDASQLAQGVTQFARREPMLFVGGALAAGFLGARFFRTSAQQAEQPRQGGQNELQGQSLPPLPDVDYGGSDVPPYDVAASDVVLDAPTDVDATLGTGMTPETGGALGDYEPVIIEDDDLGLISESDLDDLTSPETR